MCVAVVFLYLRAFIHGSAFSRMSRAYNLLDAMHGFLFVCALSVSIASICNRFDSFFSLNISLFACVYPWPCDFCIATLGYIIKLLQNIWLACAMPLKRNMYCHPELWNAHSGFSYSWSLRTLLITISLSGAIATANVYEFVCVFLSDGVFFSIYLPNSHHSSRYAF